MIEDYFKDAMTKAQFIEHANEILFGDWKESLFEAITEAQSEIALFGDSGPGSVLRIHQSIDMYNGVAKRYSQLTLTEPVRPMAYPNMGYAYYPSQDPYEHERF